MRTTPMVCTLVAALSGCVADAAQYKPDISSSDFVDGIDNPFLPLPKGGSWTYEVTDEGVTERIEVRVLGGTRTIMGVEATIVRDTVTIDGELIEDTFDWYAQDRDGNVWYLGEDTKEYEDGVVVSTLGSWEWGVDGALPGIVMLADPGPGGGKYFQEYYPKVAMDQAEVIDEGRTVTTPAGTFTDTVTTHEWTRLAPQSHEEVDYASGVGAVQKGPEDGPKEVLVSYSVPGHGP